MKIADIHAHIFPEKLAEKASHSIGSFYGVSIEREADMPRLCAEDKLAGITRCVVSNSATNASQVQNANTFLAEAVRGHDGYLAFGTIYPGMDGFEEELDRMLELGLRGIKIHPDFQKLAIDDPAGVDTYRAIAKRGLPVLFHMGDARSDLSSPERLLNLLRQAPELRPIAAHFGGWQTWQHAYEHPLPEFVVYDTSSTTPLVEREFVLRMIDRYRMNGLDVSCDCYPYDAFSTSIGSATYEDGWMERYGCSYDAVELCEGKYKGQRCTEAIFNEVRSGHPECLTVCYVMREDDVDRAFAHPNVMLASDGILSHGQGHPRAAGAFPRFLSQFARRGNLSLYDAISRMTAMPAARLGLTSKGCLRVGADADAVIFDPDSIMDCADFQHPVCAPTGIDRVLIGGVTAVEKGRIVQNDLGRSIRK